MAGDGPQAPLPERDAAAVRRSYAFVLSLSCGIWAVLVLVASAVGLRDRGGAGTAAAVVVAVTGLALLGWVLFLRGLRRRELARLEPERPGYDPRSR